MDTNAFREQKERLIEWLQLIVADPNEKSVCIKIGKELKAITEPKVLKTIKKEMKYFLEQAQGMPFEEQIVFYSNYKRLGLL